MPSYKINPSADKRDDRRDERKDDRRDQRFDNPGQDPDHPMNKTPAGPARSERDPRLPHDGTIDGPVYARENLMTEQEKGPPDPISPSEVSPGPVETIEQQGIGPRTPYPEGDPPVPVESVAYSQTIKGGTDRPSTKPGEVKRPVNTREPVR